MASGYTRGASNQVQKGLIDMGAFAKPAFWADFGQRVGGVGQGMLDTLMSFGNAATGQYDQYYNPANGQTTFGRNGNPTAMNTDASNMALMLTLGAGAVPAEAGALRMGAGVAKDSLNSILADAKAQGVKLDVSKPVNGRSVLSRIDTRDVGTGQGIGTAYMNRLTKWADENGVQLELTPSNSFGGSVGRLRGFYQRFGFKENKGRAKDFTTRETMIRPGKLDA